MRNEVAVILDGPSRTTQAGVVWTASSQPLHPARLRLVTVPALPLATPTPSRPPPRFAMPVPRLSRLQIAAGAHIFALSSSADNRRQTYAKLDGPDATLGRSGRTRRVPVTSSAEAAVRALHRPVLQAKPAN